MRTTRSFLVSVLTTVLLALGYVGGDAVGWQLREHNVGGQRLVDLFVLQGVRPFVGGIFGDGTDPSEPFGGDVTNDARVAFLAGFAVALVVFWAIVWLISRRGMLASFFGTWFAVIAATAVGCVASAILWAWAKDMSGLSRNQLALYALDHGLHWGFVFGWIPAVLAALFGAVLRKRVDEPETPDPAEPQGAATYP